MTRNALGRSSLLFVMLWLGACSSSGSSATQIVVTVDSDLTVPAELDRVTIDVSDRATAPEASADLTSQKLPRTISLVHDQGPLGPFTIKATGFLGAKRVIEKEVMTSFVEGKTVELALDLDRSCRAVFCETGRTCVAGSCQDIPTVRPGDDAGAMGDGGTNAGGTSGAEAGATQGGEAGATSGDGGATTGGAPDGGATGMPDGGNDPGDPPVCTIDVPKVGDTYERDQAFEVSGSCTDPESGNLTVDLTWISDRDGTVGSGASPSITLVTKGVHELKLCAPDPVAPSVIRCDDVSIDVAEEVQPHVTIDSVEQANSPDLPFRSNRAIDYAGSGTGAGVTLSWTDSIHGTLGTGTMVSLAQPEVGKHVVTLVGTDRNQDKGDASYPYTVLAPGQTSLVEVLTAANGDLSGNGGSADVGVLAVDPASRVYAAANGKLFVSSGGAANPSASVALDAPPLAGTVHDVFVAATPGLAYLATSAGLTVCDYVDATGIDSSCTTFDAGALASVTSVVRLTSDGDPFTIVGTSERPLVLKDDAGSDQADQIDDFDAAVRAMAVSGQALWAATDDGLYRYNPGTDKVTHSGTDQGAPTNDMTSVAVATNGATVWVGSNSGLHRYVVGVPGQWTTFDTDDKLASNTVNAVAVARTTIGGVARDVIWVATSSGVTRFDPTIPSFTSFTTADGLPSNTVRDVVVLTDGTKVFATAAGVARYTGP